MLQRLDEGVFGPPKEEFLKILRKRKIFLGRTNGMKSSQFSNCSALHIRNAWLLEMILEGSNRTELWNTEKQSCDDTQIRV